MNFIQKITFLQFIIIIILLNIEINNNINESPVSSNDIINLENISSFRNIIDSNNNESINLLLENNLYFYFFKNKNLLIYFIQNSITNEHFIYFNGIHNIKEFIDFFVHKITFSAKEFINEILNEKGMFYQINKNNNDEIECLLINNDLRDIILQMADIYKEDKIKIYGYSLGGVFSQYFIEKYFDIFNELNISLEIINIESWFDGNKSKYNNYIKKYGGFKNIFNKKSLLYIHNKIFQNYNKPTHFFEIDNLIDDKLENNDEINNYLLEIFPFGFINFWKDKHNLNYNISK